MSPTAVNRTDFDEIVNLAMQEPGRAHMRPVIEKELLHYDMLHALSDEGLLDSLTFQGGTALRLMYGGSRFSEDLDFAGGEDFDGGSLDRIRECLMDYVGRRYRLQTEVKTPKEAALDKANQGVMVSKWQLSVQTAPGRPDIPTQKIKLEVANIPAYSRNPLPLKLNYPWLPDGYSQTLVMTESADEILTDKLVSLPSCSYIRYRDIWDIAWLTQAPRSAEFDAEMLASKIADYAVEGYEQRVKDIVQRLPDIVRGTACLDALRRFLPMDVQERTLDQQKFLTYLESTVASTLRGAARSLQADDPTPEFRM